MAAWVQDWKEAGKWNPSHFHGPGFPKAGPREAQRKRGVQEGMLNGKFIN